MTTVITAAQIDACLDFPALIDALSVAFCGGIVTPVRHHHHVAREDADATLLLMPAWTQRATKPAYLGTKVVTVYPANGTKALPSVMGSYLLMDGATGQPLAILDGARLTLWRTAAASALAGRHLVRRQARRMLMVGAGALAPFFIKAHASQHALEDIAIWNRSPDASQKLADQLAAEGLPVRLAGDLESEVRAADLISCATLSTTPLGLGDWLKPGAHLDMAGAFNLSMREADDVALQRSRVFVDTQAALTEGGDVAVAIKAGAYRVEQVAGDLAALCAGSVAGRTSDDQITLFKSVGTALEDLAAAMLVWQQHAQA
ncbi:MAG: ornithine cyclodeaminase family protein [Bosea sp. (in: a-proteobacteria)]